MPQDTALTTRESKCEEAPKSRRRRRFTAVTLMPAPTLWQRAALAVAEWGTPTVTPRAATLAATAAVVTSLATFAVVRAWRKQRP